LRRNPLSVFADHVRVDRFRPATHRRGRASVDAISAMLRNCSSELRSRDGRRESHRRVSPGYREPEAMAWTFVWATSSGPTAFRCEWRRAGDCARLPGKQSM